MNNYHTPMSPHPWGSPSASFAHRTGPPLSESHLFLPSAPRAGHLYQEIHGDCGKSKSRWVGHGMTQETGDEPVGGEAEPQDSDWLIHRYLSLCSRGSMSICAVGLAVWSTHPQVFGPSVHFKIKRFSFQNENWLLVFQSLVSMVGRAKSIS